MKKRFSNRFVYEEVYLGVDCSKDPEITQQHQAADCDINNIVRKFNKTGLITHVNNKKPMYGNFSNVQEFKEMQNRIVEVNEQFMQLPAELRAKFGNDPEQLVEFVSNPENTKIAVELGILDKSCLVEVKSENVSGNVGNSQNETNNTEVKSENVPVS